MHVVAELLGITGNDPHIPVGEIVEQNVIGHLEIAGEVVDGFYRSFRTRWPGTPGLRPQKEKAKKGTAKKGTVTFFSGVLT
ncbi:MAG: hypothetical protein ACREQ1_01055, partial [Woeseiaceae bacterium]